MAGKKCVFPSFICPTIGNNIGDCLFQNVFPSNNISFPSFKILVSSAPFFLVSIFNIISSFYKKSVFATLFFAQFEFSTVRRKSQMVSDCSFLFNRKNQFFLLNKKMNSSLCFNIRASSISHGTTLIIIFLIISHFTLTQYYE